MKLTEQQFKDYLLQIRALAEGPFDEMLKEIGPLHDVLTRGGGRRLTVSAPPHRRRAF